MEHQQPARRVRLSVDPDLKVKMGPRRSARGTYRPNPLPTQNKRSLRYIGPREMRVPRHPAKRMPDVHELSVAWIIHHPHHTPRTRGNDRRPGRRGEIQTRVLLKVKKARRIRGVSDKEAARNPAIHRYEEGRKEEQKEQKRASTDADSPAQAPP